MQKCPHCGAKMIALLYSTVCSVECSKPASEAETYGWKQVPGYNMVYKIIKPRAELPKDATRAWNIIEKAGDTESSMIERAMEEWWAAGGWVIDSITDISEHYTVVTKPS